jgi:hypothetical protein
MNHLRFLVSIRLHDDVYVRLHSVWLAKPRELTHPALPSRARATLSTYRFDPFNPSDASQMMLLRKCISMTMAAAMKKFQDEWCKGASYGALVLRESYQKNVFREGPARSTCTDDSWLSESIFHGRCPIHLETGNYRMFSLKSYRWMLRDALIGGMG